MIKFRLRNVVSDKNKSGFRVKLFIYKKDSWNRESALIKEICKGFEVKKKKSFIL